MPKPSESLNQLSAGGHQKLEKEGYIEEYTIIPNFHKLGYELLALTFVKSRAGLTPEETEKARKVTHEDMKEAPAEIILFERGIGEKHGGVIISSGLLVLHWAKKKNG